MGKKIVEDRSYSWKAPKAGVTRLTRHDKGRYITGDRVTAYGIVTIYVQGGKEFEDLYQLTQIEFIWGGKLYGRAWYKALGKNAISRVCNEFIREVVGNINE